jgi:ABC-type phosphate transport system substrate-binding protein
MPKRTQVTAVLAALLASVGLAAVPGAPASAAVLSAARPAEFTEITGSGSTWAEAAIDEWISDVASMDLPLLYDADGSDAGRTDYQEGVDSFAASDVPYRHNKDKLGVVGPEEFTHFGYSYVPLIGGAVAFPYHLSVHGHMLTNLRLSGQTIMKIFTGQITNWDDPAITRDYGRRLPSMPIVPVVHAGSAATSYYFSLWLSHVYPRSWNAFCDRVHRWIRPPCGPTAFYPQVGDAQAGGSSAQVINDIQETNGTIGYDEYTYAFQTQTPVLELRNPAGRYVLPVAANVTTALTKAVVNDEHGSPDFLEENLDNVYRFKNGHSYPLSYYGYLIVPRSGTTVPSGFTSADGQTLSSFADYLLCDGQQNVASFGYAPLPRDLVRNGFKQVRRIPGHVPTPPLSSCG